MNANLIDRYVHAVGRRLPKRQRADVEAELHSLLMDALQDRAQGNPEEATVEDQVAVLREFGAPGEVAARYAPPHRYLIGPGLYNIYLIVVGATAIALTVAHLVLLVLAAWGEPSASIGSAVLGLLSSYVSALLAAFGSVTLTFAVLERVVPASAWGEAETKGDEEWDPRALPPTEDPERIERGGLIVASVFLVIALLVFNLFPEWIGFSVVQTGDGAVRWETNPLLAPVFFSAYLPWLNVLWFAQLALNVVLLRQGRWQLVTRLVDLLLSVGGIVLIGQMLTGPSLFSLASVEPGDLRDLLSNLLPNVIRLALVVALIATVGEGIAKAARLARVYVFRRETVRT
jgi:hypothetical protein